MVGRPFSCGIWTIKPGHEQDFVTAWNEMAQWTAATVDGAGWAKLLRDRDQPGRFISFGPWESLEQMASWRSLPGFAERVNRMRQHIDRLEPMTMDTVAEIGG